MAHGAPDYSNVVKPKYTYRTDDLAELVARLSKSQSFNRSGEVLFYDDFEYGYDNYVIQEFGADAAVNLYTDKFVSKGICCELIPGSDGAMWSAITYRLPYIQIGNLATEFRFNYEDFVSKVDVYLYNDDGETQLGSIYRFDFDNQIISVYDESGSWQEIEDSLVLPTPETIFNFIKVVTNFDDRTYHKIYVNNQNWDVSDYGIKEYNTAGQGYMYFKIIAYGTATKNPSFWVDNIIVTGNEP